MSSSERDIERAFVRAVEVAGGIAYKWVSPGHRGVPDRIALLPGGRLVLAELKAPGGRLSPWQEREHERMRALGFEVRVIDWKVI